MSRAEKINKIISKYGYSWNDTSRSISHTSKDPVEVELGIHTKNGYIYFAIERAYFFFNESIPFDERKAKLSILLDDIDTLNEIRISSPVYLYAEELREIGHYSISHNPNQEEEREG